MSLEMENTPESVPTLHNSKSLWALIIGIDNYEDHALTNLNGAVQDANAMRDFLIKQDVPTEHIRMLTDGDATYTGIIKAFDEHLIINPGVRHGDPLLFYFAGYGTRYKWNDQHWEAICSSDRGTDGPDDVKVPDIVKHTLDCLFATLAVTKGENITVILDCCHQSDERKGAEEGLLRVRYAPPIQDAKTRRAMFLYPDGQGPLHTQGPLPSTTCSPTTRQGVRMAAKILNDSTKLATHVLLAANGMAYEKASEGYSGPFTSSLLLVLKEKRQDVLTYHELIATILDKLADPKGGLMMQYPRCKGNNRSRPLFAIHTTRPSRRLATVAFIGGQGGTQLRVGIGAIHGVCQTTEFDIWSDKSATKFCGKLITEQVFSTYSLTKPSSGFEWQKDVEYFAGVSWWGNADGLRISVDIAPDTDMAQDERQVFAECISILRGDPHRHGIEVAAKLVEPSAKLEELNVELQEPAGELQEPAARLEKSDARPEGPASGVGESTVAVNVEAPAREPAVPLISDVRDGVMKVKRTDPMTGTVDIEFFCPTTREALRLLNRMLRFEMHLSRTNPQHPLLDTVDFAFVREGEPVENNLLDKQHRAVLPNDGAKHQFIVVNNGNKPLWVFMYYFDPVTYRITQLYGAKPTKPSLGPKPNNKLIIGDKASGVEPLSFIMAEELEEDSGFVKIFVSETYTDFKMLEEQHGLIYVNPYPNLSAFRGGTVSSEDGRWDSIVTTITVRR